MKHHRSGCVAAILLACGVAAGCSTYPDPGPLALRLPERLKERMPADLLYVIDNPARFALDENDPLLSMAPGSRIDELEGVEGCWASALLAPDPNFAAIYFLIRFDATSRTYQDWLLVDFVGVDGFLGAQHTTGPFELGPEARLATTRELTQVFGPQPENVAADSGLSVEDFVWSDEPAGRTLEYLATLDGDRLRLHYGDANRAPADPGDDLVYLRFDCAGN